MQRFGKLPREPDETGGHHRAEEEEENYVEDEEDLGDHVQSSELEWLVRKNDGDGTSRHGAGEVRPKARQKGAFVASEASLTK